jgi:hypothetical protein
LANIKADATKILKTDFLLHEKKLPSALIELTQQAAMAALRHASAIEKLQGNASLSRKEALLLREAIKLGLAMAKTDFWAELWPPADALQEKYQTQKFRLKTNSSKAVEAKRSKAEVRRRLCRNLAREYVGQKSIRKAASRIGEWIRSKKFLDELPSHSTIVNDIRDLFPERVKKKPTTIDR